MLHRVDFEVKPFLQPVLKMGLVGFDVVAKNAHRGPPIYLFETLKNWTQHPFVGLAVGAHVIYPQNDHAFDARFPHPLRGRQLGKFYSHVEWITLIEIREAIGVGREEWERAEHKNQAR